MAESDAIIRADGVGKKYVLTHRGPARGLLRDALADGAREFGRRLLGRGGRSFTTEEFWALQDVSFEVKRGEVVGVIGRNGAGKSTLLKVLSRITEPTTGRIEMNGRVASLLEVGTGFHPELTGRENIYLNGAILGMSRVEIKRKFDEIVAFAEVEKFLDTPVKRYSSGMYMRLAFAVAAHLEPEVLIVDEVLAVGDAEFQKKCLGKMKEVTSRNTRTVLFVSHNMQAVRQICTRALVMDRGRLAMDGGVDECIGHYQQRSTTDRQGWVRDRPEYGRELRVEEASVRLSGTQPNLVLDVAVRAVASGRHRPCAMSIEILSADGTIVAQATPSLEAFIPGEPGEKRVRARVELTGLIPGEYTTQVWLGTLGVETLDQVRYCGDFAILDSPTPGRARSHIPSYGYFVPASSAWVER